MVAAFPAPYYPTSQAFQAYQAWNPTKWGAQGGMTPADLPNGSQTAPKGKVASVHTYLVMGFLIVGLWLLERRRLSVSGRLSA